MASKFARLELNFAPTRRNVPIGWVLLGIGVLAATLAGAQFRSAHAERLEQETALSVISGRSQASPQASGPAVDPRAAKAAAGVARDLQVPWSEMLAALEGVRTREVALLAVEPSATHHNIRITAEAKNTDAMLDYVDALRGQSFPDVSLSSHQGQAQTPGNPVRFVMQARWRAQ